MPPREHAHDVLHAETHNALYRNKEQYDVRESMRGIKIPTSCSAARRLDLRAKPVEADRERIRAS